MTNAINQRTLKTYAYAKINLGLRVWRRRTDGYHDVTTILQRISLCDLLALTPRAKEVEYVGPELTSEPADNLCIRAARAFQQCFGEEFGVRIELNKNIPIGAGLGGGSSDAAAVMRGMARLYEAELPLIWGTNSDPRASESLTEILLAAAAELGSDVPFFIHASMNRPKTNCSAAALAEGRGERLTPVKGLSPDLTIVIIFPGYEISTAWAYQTVEEFLTFTEIDIILINRNFLQYEGGIPFLEMGNDFEKPVFKTYPELAEARQWLLQAGALFAGLSGSGSALYGVFDGEAAIRVQQLGLPAVDKRGARQSWLSFVCRPF